MDFLRLYKTLRRRESRADERNPTRRGTDRRDRYYLTLIDRYI